MTAVQLLARLCADCPANQSSLPQQNKFNKLLGWLQPTTEGPPLTPDSIKSAVRLGRTLALQYPPSGSVSVATASEIQAKNRHFRAPKSWAQWECRARGARSARGARTEIACVFR